MSGQNQQAPQNNYMYFSSLLQLFVQIKNLGKRKKTSNMFLIRSLKKKNMILIHSLKKTKKKNMFLIRQHDQTAKDFSIPGTGFV